MKYRYEFSRVTKDSIPCLQVLDHYCAPAIVARYLFKFDGSGEICAYGAAMIDKVLYILLSAGKSSEPHNVIVGDPRARLDKALEELEAAMEQYDDRTGSRSEMSFRSASKTGEVLTIETKQLK